MGKDLSGGDVQWRVNAWDLWGWNFILAIILKFLDWKSLTHQKSFYLYLIVIMSSSQTFRLKTLKQALILMAWISLIQPMSMSGILTFPQVWSPSLFPLISISSQDSSLKNSVGKCRWWLYCNSFWLLSYLHFWNLLHSRPWNQVCQVCYRRESRKLFSSKTNQKLQWRIYHRKSFLFFLLTFFFSKQFLLHLRRVSSGIYHFCP